MRMRGRGGGGGSVRQAPVEVPSALVLRLRPNCASPHARCVAPTCDARIGDAVHVVPRWGWGCPATDAIARAAVLVVPSPSLYSPFGECPCAMGFACVGEQGWTNAGRGAAHCAAAAPCIGGIAERPRGGARDGETYIETGGNVGGQGSVVHIQLRGAWGSFGVECTGAYTKRCICVLPRAVDGVGGAYGNVTPSPQTHLHRFHDDAESPRPAARDSSIPPTPRLFHGVHRSSPKHRPTLERLIAGENARRGAEADPGESCEWDSTQDI
ncbi:hypothetical protein B0H14DRAFT_2581854 [Mycena olivaceomarginata]|nr:hypothetical protein B0H14DRAFT_2581854 [Mycena olivaceomarginata]